MGGRGSWAHKGWGGGEEGCGSGKRSREGEEGVDKGGDHLPPCVSHAPLPISLVPIPSWAGV